MAKKNVAVRLSIEGGKKVKAAFTGIGDAAEKGRKQLSRELKQANRDLANFARRSKVYMTAAAAATAATGAAMVRSGLQTVDEQAKLAQSLQTTVASIQVLKRAGDLAGVSMSGIEQATKDMTRRLSQAASGTGPAIAALDRLGLSATDLMKMPLDERIAAVSDAMDQFVPKAEQAAVAGQIFGEEGSIAMGRISADTLRQANEELERYGLLISDVDAAGVERANDAISKIGMIWEGMGNSLAAKVAPTLERIANGLARSLGPDGVLGKSISFLGSNVDRAMSYAVAFAAFMGGKWVVGMAKAAFSVRGLARGLVALKGALIATGIGALIVGAGELVHWFSRLAQGAGSFGEAMSLLKDLSAEIWARIKSGAASVAYRMEAMWKYFKADGMEAFQKTIDATTDFANNIVNTFQGAKDSIVAIWDTLPGLLGSAIYTAANGILDGVEAIINGVINRINKLFEATNALILKIPANLRGDWAGFGKLDPVGLGDIENPYKGAGADTVEAIKQAFENAFADNLFTAPDLGLKDAIQEATAGGNSAMALADLMSDRMKAPLTTWQALQAAMQAAGTDGASALNDAAASADAFADAIASAGGATNEAGESISTGWAAVSEKLTEYAKSALDWGGSLGDALVSNFNRAESALRSFITTGKADFKSLVHSMLADLAVLQFRKAVLGPIAGALGLSMAPAMVTAGVMHTGGLVGGPMDTRRVNPAIFANAQRYHGGGWPGLNLAPDEVPIIAQRGERVQSRSEVARGAAGGGMVDVRIALDDDGKLMAVVERAAGNVSARVVGDAIDQYDREALPVRVAQISRHPRRRG